MSYILFYVVKMSKRRSIKKFSDQEKKDVALSVNGYQTAA